MLAIIAAVMGCAESGGAIGPQGFDQSLYGYHVDYGNPANQTFLGPDWRVDNFQWDTTARAWKQKTGDAYVATRELDEDNDGTISPGEKSEEPIYDLRLTNTADNGVIWVKAHPLAFQDSGRDLGVVINNYADSLAGTGLYYQGSIFTLEHVKARQYTTFVDPTENVHAASVDGLIATTAKGAAGRMGGGVPSRICCLRRACSR